MTVNYASPNNSTSYKKMTVKASTYDQNYSPNVVTNTNGNWVGSYHNNTPQSARMVVWGENMNFFKNIITTPLNSTTAISLIFSFQIIIFTTPNNLSLAYNSKQHKLIFTDFENETKMQILLIFY